MGLVNAITLASTTHNLTSGASGSSGGEHGNKPNSYDNDFSTYWGSWSHVPAKQGPNCSSTATAEHTFSKSLAISNIKVKMLRQTAKTAGGQLCWLRVWIKQGGSWVYIYNDTDNNPGGGTVTLNLDDITQYTCSGVKVETHAESYANQDNAGDTTTYIYEVQAFMAYVDKGLRVNTSAGNVAIGTEDLGTHKLRVYGNSSTTYGIPLLSTTDSNASALRIFDGTSVKALPKVI